LRHTHAGPAPTAEQLARIREAVLRFTSDVTAQTPQVSA
jgi:hypothetical protein